MIETWLARTFIVILAFLMLFIAGAGVGVWLVYYRRFKRPAGGDESFNSQGWTALVVCAVLEVLLAAVMDVGQAFLLVSEGWGAIVGITGTLLLPILGYKSVQAISAGKNAPTTITGA